MRHHRRQQLAQEAAKEAQDLRTRRGKQRRSVFSGLLFAALITASAYQALFHPQTPLPREWNPVQPLYVADPVTPLTNWKLNVAAEGGDACLATLAGYAALDALSPLQDSAQCFIQDRVNLQSVGEARLSAVETRCAIALRLAMWERHSLQPAAALHLGTQVRRIEHFGSYNCRQMRTSSGTSPRMSTHATADAIDVAGFVMEDGSRVRLLSDWDAEDGRSEFLHAARDGACRWFETTLSPDFNRLHADHFHLQSRGWGTCR